ncbi:MAG: hypothetical protein ACW99G_19860 [Candidatus Thorarchaeota archaeon]
MGFKANDIMPGTVVTTITPGGLKSNKDKILARLADLRRKDPKLYESLKMMVENLDAVTIHLNPIEEVTARAQAAQELPPPVIAFGYTLSSTAVTLSWTAPSPIGSTLFYEIRQGADWDTAAFVLRTPSTSAALNPLAVGNTQYLIKTLNALGDFSVDSATTTVVVPALATPVITAQVIDNNVLLTWTEPTSSFTVDYYEVLKDGVVQGELSGTWMALFESTSGSYIYGVIAYDIAGNASPEGQVNVDVDEPPDFELYDSWTPDLTLGVHSSTYYEATDGKVYGPADLTEQFQTHFTDQGWASPNAQYVGPNSCQLFIQENPLTGLWTGVEYDIGTDLSNVIVNCTFVGETVPTTDAPTFSVEMQASTDAGGPGSGAWTSGTSQFFATVRYVNVRITITAAGAAPRDSMGRFHNVQMTIAVKNVVDGNNIVCAAADAQGDAAEEGTIVKFPNHATYPAGGAGLGHGTKIFSDIASITLAPIDTGDPGSGQAVTAIYDFVDVPDPTYFTILCFDSAGRRVAATVGWKVKGVKA